MKPSFPWKTTLWSALAAGGSLALVWRARLDAGHSSARVPNAAVSAGPETIATLTPAAAEALSRSFWEACQTWSEDGVRQLIDGVSRKALALLDGVSAPDIALLLTVNESEKDAARRNHMRTALFERYSCLDPEKALALAKTWPPEIADQLLAPLLDVWRRHDPQIAATVKQLFAEKPGDWKQLRELFAATPSSEDEKKSPVPHSLADAWEESVRRMAENPAGTIATEDMESLIAWAGHTGQWEAALEKLTGMPDAFRRDYSRAIHESLAVRDWRRWLAWMEAHPEEGLSPASGDSYRDDLFLGAATQIAHRVLDDAPREETLAFLNAWKEHWPPERSDIGPGRLFKEWVQEDPSAASGWLTAQPAASWRNQAAAILAETAVGEEPESAFAWAAGISDPALRERTLVKCWQTWRRLEPAAADAWVDEHQPGIRAAAERIEARRRGH